MSPSRLQSESCHHQSLLEGLLKLRASALAPELTLFEGLQGPGELHPVRHTLQRRGGNPPVYFQTIGLQAAIEIVMEFAIKVDFVTMGPGSQLGDIETGIGHLKGVEGPHYPFQAALSGPVLLGQFEPGGQTSPLVLGEHGGQMRVEVVAGHKAQHKTQHRPVFPKGQQATPVVSQSLQGMGRHHLQVKATPGSPLQGLQFLITGGNLDVERHTCIKPWRSEGSKEEIPPMRAWLGVGALLLALVMGVGAQSWEDALPSYELENARLNRRWLAERHQQTGAPYAVFADTGVWHLDAVTLTRLFEEKKLPVRVVDRNHLDQLEGVQILVLPGGLAQLQAQAMGWAGMARLRAFAEGGGHVLGICAGGYLISQKVRYDGVEYPYPIGLFDGVADGPVPGLARYPDLGCARVQVTAEGRALGLGPADGKDFLYGGGPRFLEGNDVTVLLRYHDGSPAAITRAVGKGRVTALGIHMERPYPETFGSPSPMGLTLLRALLRLPTSAATVPRLPECGAPG